MKVLSCKDYNLPKVIKEGSYHFHVKMHIINLRRQVLFVQTHAYSLGNYMQPHRELVSPPTPSPCEKATVYTVVPQLFSKPCICLTFTKVFAHIIPDAATAGTPIPGMVLSPTRYNPFIGVLVLGNVPLPAAIPGP